MAINEPKLLLPNALVTFARNLEISDVHIARLAAIAFDEIVLDSAPTIAHSVFVTVVHTCVVRYRLTEAEHAALVNDMHELMS